MTRWAHRAGTGGSKILPFGNCAIFKPIIDANKINTFIFPYLLLVALTKKKKIISARDQLLVMKKIEYQLTKNEVKHPYI